MDEKTAKEFKNAEVMCRKKGAKDVGRCAEAVVLKDIFVRNLMHANRRKRV